MSAAVLLLLLMGPRQKGPPGSASATDAHASTAATALSTIASASSVPSRPGSATVTENR